MRKSNREIGYVDMDGVLADFDEKVERLYTTVCASLYSTPKKLPPIGTDERSKLVDLFEPAAGFYRDLKPVDGAIEAFKKLSEKYNMYILSTASWSNPSSWTDKRLWVEEHLGEYAHKKLILSHNKGLLMGKFLIDDRIKNGVADFKGEHIHFRTSKFPEWKQVLEHLM